MMDDLRKKLESSPVSRSEQHRLKMLLNDIEHNRYRVQSIFTLLNTAQDVQDIYPKAIGSNYSNSLLIVPGLIQVIFIYI